MDKGAAGWTFVFDLDGTMIDTAPDLIATANVTLERWGFQPVDSEILRPIISFGSRKMLETGIARQTSGSGQPPAAKLLDEMFDAFLAHYRDNIAVHSRPFPQFRETVRDLRQCGATLAVCTNKLVAPATELLDALGLKDEFAVIAGRDTFDFHKPDPRHLLGVIERARGSRDRAVMVGDSDVDVQTAKRAGVPIIGVTFGYTPVAVADLGCDAVIDHFSEIHGAFDAILANSRQKSAAEK